MVKEAKKPYHHGDLRETLLVAGEACLRDMRLEDVSLREIARRAGVSHAAPKHHFPTLGVLLGEIAARGYVRFVDTLAENANASPDQSPPARLQAMSRAYVRFAISNTAVYGLMFGKREQVEVTPNMAQGMYAAWQQLEDQVAEIVGRVRAPDAAMFVWSSVHGLSTLANDRRMPPHIDPVATIERAGRMVAAGLKAEG